MAHKIPYSPSPKGSYPVPELETIREYEIGFGSDSLHQPSPHWYARFYIPDTKAYSLLIPLVNLWNSKCWPIDVTIENDKGEATFHWPIEDVWIDEAAEIPIEAWHKLKKPPVETSGQ